MRGSNVFLLIRSIRKSIVRNISDVRLKSVSTRSWNIQFLSLLTVSGTWSKAVLWWILLSFEVIFVITGSWNISCIRCKTATQLYFHWKRGKLFLNGARIWVIRACSGNLGRFFQVLYLFAHEESWLFYVESFDLGCISARSWRNTFNRNTLTLITSETPFGATLTHFMFGKSVGVRTWAHSLINRLDLAAHTTKRK